MLGFANALHRASPHPLQLSRIGADVPESDLSFVFVGGHIVDAGSRRSERIIAGGERRPADEAERVLPTEGAELCLEIKRRSAAGVAGERPPSGRSRTMKPKSCS
mmetsp:Transcript_32594/g.95405  ORF Transcript_32594/g.95405 Transcript_32594/m.95405 type:complete len:105 (-) Transcript_32594:348-662(-)